MIRAFYWNGARCEQLQPGVYVDEAGGLHLLVSEMLEAYGYADTLENRARLEQAARDVFGQGGAGAVIDVIE